jgi:hypothetical protein
VAKSGMCPTAVLRILSVGMRLSGSPKTLSIPKGSLGPDENATTRNDECRETTLAALQGEEQHTYIRQTSGNVNLER